MVYAMFGGRMQSQIKCMSCAQLSTRWESFLDLSLELSAGNSIEVWLCACVRVCACARVRVCVRGKHFVDKLFFVIHYGKLYNRICACENTQFASPL